MTPPAGTPPGSYHLSAGLTYRSHFDDEVRRTWTEDLVVPEPVPAGVSNLGDVRWATARNGFGPVERDMSNGGIRPGDGKPLTINGRVYAMGLGTHADASVLFYLGKRCGSLTVDVGIDDERDPRPDPTQSTAIFEIWADGVKVADSGLRTWHDDADRHPRRGLAPADRDQRRPGRLPVGPRRLGGPGTNLRLAR